MSKVRVLWPKHVQDKILSYQSKHFTDEETHQYIISWILQVDNLLLNPVLSKTYTEEYGTYKGVSRIVVNKLKVYYERHDDDIVILAVIFPGEE